MPRAAPVPPPQMIPGFDPTGDDHNLRGPGQAIARPRAAASLVLLRRDGPQPRVLLGRRPATMRFMPGKYVFPGGLPRRSDAQVPHHGGIDTAPRHCGCAPRALERLALAAVRETFEETGLRIHTPSPAPIVAPRGWRGFCADTHVPDLTPVQYLGRAITPTLLSVRFDARFFWMDATALADQPVQPSDEFDDLRWCTLAETADLPLPAVTRYMLRELEQMLTQPQHRPVFLYARALRAVEVR